MLHGTGFSDCFWLDCNKTMAKDKHDSVALKLLLVNDVALRALAAGFGYEENIPITIL